MNHSRLSSPFFGILFAALAVVATVPNAPAQPMDHTDGIAALAGAQQNARIKWRFQIPAAYTAFHPAIAADGTIYVNDVHGRTYALNPDGTLKWSVQTGLTGADGPVSVGGDGTIYVMTILPSGPGNEPAIIALNPNGTEKWHYIATGGISGRGGPNVGPDGKIYAIVRPTNTSTAHNLFALNPNGTLAWNYNEGIYRYGQLGDKDIVFGRTIDQLYFQYEAALRDNRIPQLWAFGLGGDLRWTRRAGNGDTAVSPLDDSVHTETQAFLPNGDPLWVLPLFGQGPTTNPEVGPDGVHYVQQGYNTLFAINPNGTEKWRTGETGLLYNIALGSSVLFSGGRPTYGASGFFVGYNPANGNVLFRILLPDEPGFAEYGQVVPNTRPVFAADGVTAYVGANVAGSSGAGAYSYFYAIDTSPDLPCSYEVSPETQAVPVNGGSFAVQLVATSESCPWTAQSNSSWLAITSATTGTGNATVTYTAAANTLPQSRTGSVTIAGRTVTVDQPAAGANAPQAAITYPAANAVFTQPANVFVRADASAANGRSISRVDFYGDGQLIGSDSSVPYQIVWNSPTTGSPVLVARAIDSAGEMANSQPVSIVVNPPSGGPFPLPIGPPTLNSPQPEATFPAPGPITFSATPAPTNYPVVRVDFYVDTTLVGSDTTPPYAITWNNASPGRYAISARTVVNTGARATSAPIDITVTGTPATLLSAVSRKTHGVAGTYDIALPLTGTPGIECRTAGATDDFQLVLTFSAGVTVTGNPQAEITSGTALIGTAGRANGGQVETDGSIITIPLTDVANAQTLTVTLRGVDDGNTVRDVAVPLRVLFGDVTGNGSVNTSDIAQVKANAGATVNQTTFRSDLTANGSINTSDVGAVKAASGGGAARPARP